MMPTVVFLSLSQVLRGNIKTSAGLRNVLKPQSTLIRHQVLSRSYQVFGMANSSLLLDIQTEESKEWMTQHLDLLYSNMWSRKYKSSRVV